MSHRNRIQLLKRAGRHLDQEIVGPTDDISPGVVEDHAVGWVEDVAVDHEQLPVLQPEIDSIDRRQATPAQPVVRAGTAEPGTKILPLHDRGGRAVDRRAMQGRQNVARCSKPRDGRLQLLSCNDRLHLELTELGFNAILLIDSSGDKE
jgi:hypothetical protein